MKRIFIQSIILVGALCAPSYLYPIFGADLDKADKILDGKITRLEELAKGLNGTVDSFATKVGTSLGTNLVTSGTTIIDRGKETALELFEQSKNEADIRIEQLKVLGDKVKQDQLDIIQYIANLVRLAPGYAVGTSCLVGSIAMYWQAFDHYLNGPKKQQSEEELHQQIMRKIKFGTGFLIAGAFTLYFNRPIAHMTLGYEYPAAPAIKAA